MNPQLESARRQASSLLPWVVVGIAVAVQSVVHLTNEVALDGRYGWLNAASDWSVFGRANTAAIGLSAVLVGVAAFRARRPLQRALLCACLLLVTVDDATGIHDRLRGAPKTRDAALGIAVVCVLGLTLILLCAEVARATATPKRLLVVGLGASLHTAQRAVGVVGEQGLDFGGWLLVACGLLGATIVEGQPTDDGSLHPTGEATGSDYGRERKSARSTQ